MASVAETVDRINDAWSISNKTYYEDYTQLQLEYAQRYFNDIRESFNFQNRFELRGTFDSHQFITGLSYRDIHVLASLPVLGTGKADYATLSELAKT